MNNTDGNRHKQKEHDMTIKDIGPDPQSFNLEQQTVENSNYRTVAWSGKYLQLTLMSIPEGDDIGLEMHPETDQFLRLDAGRGRVQMGPTRENLDFDQRGVRRMVHPGAGRYLAQRHQHRKRADAGVCDLCTCPPQARQGTRHRGRRGHRHRRRACELVRTAGISNRSPRLRPPY